MIKRFVVVISFLLGVLVIITWLFQLQGRTPLYHLKDNWITILLLVITWGTPFILFRPRKNKPGK